MPTLLPFEADGESVDVFVFGEFEVEGEMDEAASHHMVTFHTNLLGWYKSKNYISTILTKEHYYRIYEFCEKIIDGVDCADFVRKGCIQD